jgi:hypothetical protein
MRELLQETAPNDAPSGPGSIPKVDLAPCVNTLVRWPPRQEAEGDFLQNRMQVLKAQEAMSELNDIMSHAETLRARLSAVLNVPEQPKPKREGRNRR